jgi:hypothetical protein
MHDYEPCAEPADGSVLVGHVGHVGHAGHAGHADHVAGVFVLSCRDVPAPFDGSNGAGAARRRVGRQ